MAGVAIPKFDHQINPARTVNSPAELDLLDRRPLAARIARYLLDEQPRVVGIYGSWGSGKSFLLDLTIQEIFSYTGDITPVVCHFQPWRYEPDVSLAPGLIQSLENVSAQFPGFNPSISDADRNSILLAGEQLRLVVRRAVGWLAKFARFAQVVYSNVPQGVLPLQPVIGAALSGAAQLDATRDDGEWSPDQLHHELLELLHSIRLGVSNRNDLPETAVHIIVVIDDLDRCAPDLLVDMLNWLKLHLSVEGCSYLIALDHGAAARAIVGKYGAYLGADVGVTYGFRYLEKIVDAEFELSTSDLVEEMAVQSISGAQSVVNLIDELTSKQGVRTKEIQGLLKLTTLRSPRTMLKLTHRFVGSLQRVLADAAIDDSGVSRMISSDAPLWLLCLSAMYYRVSPEAVSRFCDAQSVDDILSFEKEWLPLHSEGDQVWNYVVQLVSPQDGDVPNRVPLPTPETRRYLLSAVRSAVPTGKHLDVATELRTREIESGTAPNL